MWAFQLAVETLERSRWTDRVFVEHRNREFRNAYEVIPEQIVSNLREVADRLAFGEKFEIDTTWRRFENPITPDVTQLFAAARHLKSYNYRLSMGLSAHAISGIIRYQDGDYERAGPLVYRVFMDALKAKSNETPPVRENPSDCALPPPIREVSESVKNFGPWEFYLRRGLPYQRALLGALMVADYTWKVVRAHSLDIDGVEEAWQDIRPAIVRAVCGVADREDADEIRRTFGRWHELLTMRYMEFSDRLSQQSGLERAPASESKKEAALRRKKLRELKAKADSERVRSAAVRLLRGVLAAALQTDPAAAFREKGLCAVEAAHVSGVSVLREFEDFKAAQQIEASLLLEAFTADSPRFER